MKALVLLMVTAALLAWPGGRLAQAQATGTAIHVFGSSKCHLCAEAAKYLRAVAEREGAVVFWHDSDESPRQAKLMRAVASELKMSVDGYPFIVVGRRAHLGWKGATTGLIVTSDLAQVRAAGEEDVVARLELTIDAQQREVAPRRDQPVGFGTISLGAAAAVVLVAALALIISKQRQKRSL